MVLLLVLVVNDDGVDGGGDGDGDCGGGGGDGDCDGDCGGDGDGDGVEGRQGQDGEWRVASCPPRRRQLKSHLWGQTPFFSPHY